MNHHLLLQLILSLIMGMLLGIFFFGGLWLTIKKMQKAAHPGLLILTSALCRTALTLTGFWFVGIWLSETGRWQRMTICLIGFMIARYVCTRQARMADTSAPRESVS